jgi:peptidoglycan/xylan/chitin deacetylase (PgdA/CDA1 family)
VTAPAEWEFKLRGAAYYRGRAAYERLRLAASRSRAQSDGAGVRILGYHRVSDAHDVLAVAPSLFRAQLEAALDEGFTAISLRESLDVITASRERRYLVVTFDDGYRDNLENAFPVLQDLQVPATIFVPTAVISREATYHWYREPPPALSWDELRELLATGLVDVQAHGRRHYRLPALPDEVAQEEIAGARADLERQLELQPFAFCYAAGVFGPRERELVRRAGYRAGITTNPGTNRGDGDLLQLRRTMILWSDRLSDFRAKIQGALDDASAVERMVRRRRSRGSS